MISNLSIVSQKNDVIIAPIENEQTWNVDVIGQIRTDRKAYLR